MGLKQKTWQILANEDPENRISQIINRFILTLIMLNVVAVIIESVPAIYTAGRTIFQVFEFFSLAVFLSEYLLRLWSCTASSQYAHPILGRLKYMFTFLAIVDLVAILPSLLLLVGSDFRAIRALRLMRLFLLAKTGRYTRSMGILGKVFLQKREELIISFSLLVFLLVTTSTLMYYVENHAQPESFSSIPATMWWAVATLTTVGYGDIAPITGLGKLLGSVVAIIGIGLFALPTGILGSGFLEAVEQSRELEVTCPHCGKEFTHHGGD